MPSSRHLLVAAPLALLILSSCAEERDPINRVQPNVIRKVDLDGEWYHQQTIIELETSGLAGFVGWPAFFDLERVRWDVQEDYLYARRAYELIENTDSVEHRPGSEDLTAGARLFDDGQPFLGGVVAAFRVQSHFDIRREYNPTTGEEINVITENTTDRPWHEREYMRVDWSENLATNYNSEYFFGWGHGELIMDPVSYYVQENGPAEHQPVFDYAEDGTLNYFDVVLQIATRPGVTYLDYYEQNLPTCWLYSALGEDCNTSMMTVRASFMRVDEEEQDFEPVEHKGPITEMFGIFNTTRDRYDHREGMREMGRRRYAQVFNVWERSHTEETCQSEEDCPEPGSRCDDNVGLQIGLCSLPWEDTHVDQDCETDADCELETSWCEPRADGASQCTRPNVAQYSSIGCDMDSECPSGTDCLVQGRCTIPLADRDPRPIVFYMTGRWPEDLSGAMDYIESEWDRVTRNSIAAAQGHNDPDSVRQMFMFCHSPVREDDHEECGQEGYTVRLGDIRHHQIYYHDVWNPQGLLAGFGPSYADPLTGRAVAGGVIIFDTIDSIAYRQLELARLLNGELSPTEFVDGENLTHWVAEIRADAVAPGAEGRERDITGEDYTGTRRDRELTQDDVRAMYRARDTSWMATLRQPADHGAPEGMGHEVLPELMQRLRQTGAFDPDRDLGQGFLETLEGTPVESALQNEAWLVGNNVPPGVPLDTTAATEASILSPRYGALQDARQELQDHFSRQYCFRTDAAELHDPAFQYLSERLAGMEEEEAIQLLREEIAESLILHELGHAFGLYHNFTASEDTVNFPEEWWSVRTDGFTRRPRTRVEDPMTEEELRGGLVELGHTSVMDYTPNYSCPNFLGRYDNAAILYAYGRSVEVYEEVSGGLTPDDLDEYWQSYGTHLQFTSGRPRALHHTEMYNLMGADLFSEDNRRIVSVNGLQDDLMTWIDPDAADPETAEVLHRVPYLFCDDNHADLGENCHRSDFGYDMYDRMRYWVEQDPMVYLRYNFRRGNRRLYGSADPVVSSLYRRYYTRFKIMHDYYNLIDAIIALYYDDDVREDFMTDMQRGFGAYTVAIHDGFNLLAQSLTRPHVDLFQPVTAADGSEMWAESGWGHEDAFRLPLIDSRYFSTAYYDTDYDRDCGQQYWECVHRYGFYLNKIIALLVLGEAETFFVGRDSAEDVRRYRISYFDDFAPQIMDLVGGIMSEDYQGYAPYIIPAEGDAEPEFVLRDYAAPELDPVRRGSLPADSLPIDPSTGFTVQMSSAVVGMGMMHTNFDNRFIFSSRMWIDGGDHGVDDSEIATTCYEDSETGIRYCALARSDGSGIAQRMIDHANRLRARSPECNRTEPDAPDACVFGLSDDEERTAEREMHLYRDQLDILVNLTSRYDNWYFTYGDPFNPGDVPPDW